MTWVNAQTFLTTVQSEYRKMVHSGVIAKVSSFLFKEQSFTFPIRYELSPCKDGRFNMETLWAGKI